MQHLEDAIEMCRNADAKIWRARVQCDHARALLRRPDRADREQGLAMARQVIEEVSALESAALELEANALATQAAAEESATTIAGQETEIADLTKKVIALAPGLKVKAAQRAASAASDGASAQGAFLALVKDIMKAESIGYNAALAKAQTEHPEEFAEYLAAPKTRK